MTVVWPVRALLVAALLALTAPVAAQTTVTPPEDATEATPPPPPSAQTWERIRHGETGTTAVAGPEAGRLIQAEGLAWRDRNVFLVRWGGVAVLGVTMLGIIAFWAVRGRIRMTDKPSRRRVERFGHAQRTAHWLVGLSFVMLALSGFFLTYGRVALLPYMTRETLASIAGGAKLVHDFVGPAFAAGLVAMAVLWGRHALPAKGDGAWLLRGGGLMSRDEAPMPAGRLNAAQKLLFWLTLAGGTALAVSGAYLLFPFLFTGIHGMQAAQLVHAGMAVAMTALALVHLYFGTVGFQGSFAAAASGQVDRNWARFHHSEWMKQVRKAERDAQRAAAEQAAVVEAGPAVSPGNSDEPAKPENAS